VFEVQCSHKNRNGHATAFGQSVAIHAPAFVVGKGWHHRKNRTLFVVDDTSSLQLAAAVKEGSVMDLAFGPGPREISVMFYQAGEIGIEWEHSKDVRIYPDSIGMPV
jgi:hypothetical protein